MPRKILGTFNTEFLQIMDEDSKVDQALMPKLTNEEIKKMYSFMVLTRVFDDKVFKLQRQGRMGTYGTSTGQEACTIGSSFAMQQSDWVFPAFREHGVFITRGVPLSQYMQFWGGDERGMKIPDNVNIFTVSVPVATHIPHAAGCAWAMKLKKEKSVAVAYFGDGATSKGDFHEAMNFAGVLKAPCVFICQNNQWAISVPFSHQTGASTVAQKAIAYGFNGIRVDGNDVFAVYVAAKEAFEKARNGGGPTLIECFTYRMGDHTTSDDARRYRADEEVEAWKKKDPITRLEKYMIDQKIMTENEKNSVWMDAEEKVDKAVAEYESIEKPAPEDMFKYVYATMPPELEEQYTEVKNNAKKDDDKMVHAG